MSDSTCDDSSNRDEWLVRAARLGERDAFEHLIRRYARLIYSRIAVDRSIDAHRIEDLTQETFLLAWQKLSTLEEPRHFRAWIASIADRVVIDSVRKESRRKRSNGSPVVSMDLQDAPLQIASSRDGPSEIAIDDEQQARALTALNELPEPYRAPLTMRYLGGMEFDEICDRLSISRGSLRGLLQRGLALLRKTMPARFES